MMRLMREKPVFVLGVIVFVVGAFVGTIFLVYGMKSGGGGSGPAQGAIIAVVEGVDIPYSEYVGIYNNQIEFYRQFYPEIGVTELEERFMLKEKALEAMVNSRLLLAEAERMGVVVGDTELRRNIEKNELFQEAGRFSDVKYRQILGASRVSPAAFEESQRAELLASKVRAIVSDAAKVTAAEVWEDFRREKEKVGLRLLPLDVETYRNWVSTTDDEVLSRYENNPEKYRRPDRIHAEYLAIESASFEKRVELSEEALTEHYDLNLDDFRTPAQIRARHILIRVPEGSGTEREEELRERAAFVREKSLEGAEFAELAKEFSQDTTGPTGGELGWFGRGQMVPPFEEAAFGLEAGEVSDVVRTQYGFHVIKVEETREEGVEAFENVRSAVEEGYRKQESRNLASLTAEQVSDELLDGEFAGVAEKFGLEVKRVDRLGREDLLPGFGYRPEVSSDLFSLDEGQISDIYRQARDYYVFRVAKKNLSYIPSFEEAEGEVREELIGEKADEKARKEAESMLGKLRGGAEMKSVASMLKAEVQETGFFGRAGFVLEAGDQGEKFAEAFRAGEGRYGGPVSAGGKVWIFQVKEMQPASEEEFAEVREERTVKLDREKKDRVFESWLENLRAIRSVEIDETLLGT